MKSRPIILSIILVLFGLYCAKGLFFYSFFSAHDLDYHLARGFDAITTLKEGHFPLRWAGSLNGRCGVPVYNFFYPLVYCLVFLLNFLIKDVFSSFKVLAAMSLIIAPLFFYWWLKKETKNDSASFTGAFLYLFLPYRFLLVFVRFSPEFLTYTILPILLYFLALLFESIKMKNSVAKTMFYSFICSITGAFLIISHNFAIMLILPIIFAYVIYKVATLVLLKRRELLLIIFVCVSLIGLSSFFLGPLLLEKNEVRLGFSNVVNYQDHFSTFIQTVRSKWGYGGSSPGTTGDGMSFMLGYAQWLVLGTVIIYLLALCRVRKKLSKSIKENRTVIFWLAISLFSLFLVYPGSAYIWKMIKPLSEMQFPWRFLGVSGFAIAALTGFFLSAISNKKLVKLLVIIFLLLAFVGNRNHLRPQPVLNPDWYVNFEEKHPSRFAPTTVNDDILNKESLETCLVGEPLVVINSSENKITWQVKRGNTFGKITLYSPKEQVISLAKLNLEYFPGIYRFTLNQKRFNNFVDCEGRICLKSLKLIKGDNQLDWQISQSPTQTIFNFISLTFLAAWAVIIILSYGKKRRS